MKQVTSFGKGLISAVALIVVFSVIIIGCKKESQKSITYEDPSKLSEDKVFIKLTFATNGFLVSLADHINRNTIKKMDLLSSLHKMESKHLDYNQQLIELNNIFKGDAATIFTNFYQTTSSLWDNIKKRYASIPNEMLEKECLEVLSNRSSTESDDLIKNKRSYMEKEEGGCGWRYYLCASAATAGAILCHAACEGSAIAVTAGMGIPACLVACGTLQAYAITECADKYCTKN